MFKKKLYSALLFLLTLCLSLQILPDHAHAASGGDTACHLSNCTCSNCGWKYLYVSVSADSHATHIACTTCSAAYGVSTDPHTFSGDTCTLCGYVRSSSGGGDTSCSHGRYTYNCEYYNSNYHYVSKVCRDCGEEVDYFRENHSLRDSFSQAVSPNHINALDMEQGYGDGENPVVLKSEFLLSLCEQLVGSGQLSAKEKSIIDRCTAQVYHGYIRSGYRGTVPTLQDFHAELLRQPEPEARDVALAIELFTEGSLNTFAKPTNVDTNSRILCYDIRDFRPLPCES